jgi:hypothetical protein
VSLQEQACDRSGSQRSDWSPLPAPRSDRSRGSATQTGSPRRQAPSRRWRRRSPAIMGNGKNAVATMVSGRGADARSQYAIGDAQPAREMSRHRDALETGALKASADREIAVGTVFYSAPSLPVDALGARIVAVERDWATWAGNAIDRAGRGRWSDGLTISDSRCQLSALALSGAFTG